jgi:hypothetical protein
MLDIAVTFLADELNSYLRKRGVFTQAEDLVVPTPLVNDKGEWLVAEGKIGMTLINIEEERILREQVPDQVYLNGSHIVIQPALKLNLTLMFSARMSTAAGSYRNSLNFLSHVLTFFQSHPSFTADNSPGLDARIVKLNADLLSYTPEQLNQTWAYLGSKYLPSAIYRVRMVTLQDSEPKAINKPVSGINTETTLR